MITNSKTKLIYCPLCGSEKHEILFETLDYFLTGEKFCIEKCKDCGHVFTNPQPPESRLGDYYKSEEYLSHKENAEGLLDKIYATVRWLNLRTKYRQATKGLSIGTLLDYGCGRGDFLRLAKARGWDTLGIEQDPDAKKFAIEQHDVKVLSPEEDASLTPGQFNLITMFHVLEHLPDVHSTMRKLCSWLAPDGRLVIAVPNHQSYDAEVYGPYWAAWDVPRHLHHFSRNSMFVLAEKHGLTIRKIYPMYWDAFFVAMLSDRYKGDHNSFVRAGLLGLKSNLKAISSGQYSSLMFILGKSR